MKWFLRINWSEIDKGIWSSIFVERGQWGCLKWEPFKGRWIVRVEIVLIRMHMFKLFWHAIVTWNKLSSHSHANWTNKGAFMKSFMVEFGMLYEVGIAMPNYRIKEEFNKGIFVWEKKWSRMVYIFNEIFAWRPPSLHAHVNITKKVHFVEFWKLFCIILIQFACPCE